MRSLRELFRRRGNDDALACRSAIALLADYLDDDLPTDDKTRLEAHLVGCGHCSEYLSQIRTAIRLAGRTETDDVDADIRAALTDIYRTLREP